MYLKNIDSRDVWVKGNFKSSTEQNFLSLDDLNQKLKAAGFTPITAMPPIQFNNPLGWVFNANGNKLVLNPVTNKIKVLIDKSIINEDIVEEISMSETKDAQLDLRFDTVNFVEKEEEENAPVLLHLKVKDEKAEAEEEKKVL